MRLESSSGGRIWLISCHHTSILICLVHILRGLKREDLAMLTGLLLCHNFIRQHLGLPDHTTPAQTAGILIEGNDK